MPLNNLVIYFVLIAFCLPLQTDSNFNFNLVDEYASRMAPVEVPVITQQQRGSALLNISCLNKHRPKQQIAFSLPKEGAAMHSIDFVLLRQSIVPQSVLFLETEQEYYLLQNAKMKAILTNPSEICTICIESVRVDSIDIWLSRTQRRMPFCVNPLTKFPLLFTFHPTQRFPIPYVLYFNVVLRDGVNDVASKVWIREFKPAIMPNYLNAMPVNSHYCPHKVFLKNHQSTPLHLQLDRCAGSPCSFQHSSPQHITVDSKAGLKLVADKTGTWWVKGKSDKPLPDLHVPIDCLAGVVLQKVHIGLIPERKQALKYPIFVSNHLEQDIEIVSVKLDSLTQTVSVGLNNSSTYIRARETMRRVGWFIIRSSKTIHHHAWIHITILFQKSSSSKQKRVNEQSDGQSDGQSHGQVNRHLTYKQIDAVEVIPDLAYNLSLLKTNNSKRVRDYSLRNNLDFPVRLEKVLLDRQLFAMEWVQYDNSFVYPGHTRKLFRLEYIGPLEIPLSPTFHEANLIFSSGLSLPLKITLTDDSLTCIYKQIQTKCTHLQLLDLKFMKHTQAKASIIFKNMHLSPAKLTLTLPSTALFNITLSFQEDARPSTSLQHLYTEIASGSQKNLILEFDLARDASNETIPLDMECFGKRIKINLSVHAVEGALFLSQGSTIYSDSGSKGFLVLKSTFPESYTVIEARSSSSLLMISLDLSESHEAGEDVRIEFSFSPLNVTDECCGESFMKEHFINRMFTGYEDEVVITVYVRTSTGLEQQLNVVVEDRKMPLLAAQREMSIGLLRSADSQFNFKVANPYDSHLKYEIYLFNPSFLERPTSFYAYLKHTRRENAKAQLCIPEDRADIISSFKQLFHLDIAPLKIIRPVQTQYVIAMQAKGYKLCFQMSTSLYLKILIETEVINFVLDNYSLLVWRQFIQKQITAQTDQLQLHHEPFYADFSLTEYCSRVIFPIFHFCMHSHILPLPSQVQVLRFRVGPSAPHKFSSHIIVVNNHSKYDRYLLNFQMIEPRIGISVASGDSLAEVKDGQVRLVVRRQNLLAQCFVGSLSIRLSNQASVDVPFKQIVLSNNQINPQDFRLSNRFPDGMTLQAGSQHQIQMQYDIPLRTINSTKRGQHSTKRVEKQVDLLLVNAGLYYLRIAIIVELSNDIVDLTVQASPSFADIWYAVLSFASVVIICATASAYRQFLKYAAPKYIVCFPELKKIIGRQQLKQNQSTYCFGTGIPKIAQTPRLARKINQNQLLLYGLQSNIAKMGLTDLNASQESTVKPLFLETSADRNISVESVSAVESASEIAEIDMQRKETSSQSSSEMLSEGVAVTNDQLRELDSQNFGFGVGEEKKDSPVQSQDSLYYNVFRPENPLKHNPFPFLHSARK